VGGGAGAVVTGATVGSVGRGAVDGTGALVDTPEGDVPGLVASRGVSSPPHAVAVAITRATARRANHRYDV